MNTKNSRYAYVFLVMKGDDYSIGAMVAAHSLKKTETKNDIICMVTNDVSVSAINKLKLFFNQVILVNYIKFKTKEIKFKKIKKMYRDWISSSFTKWNILTLKKYEKVMFLDADLIVKSNIDHLFELKTPAATFSLSQERSIKNKRGVYNPYNNTHGKFVDRKCIQKGYGKYRNPSFVCIGTTLILSPSMEHFNLYKKIIKKNEPFGFINCINGFDEQSIVWFYDNILKQRWTHIDPSYNMIPWKTNIWKHLAPPKILHYVGKNPWELNRNKWPDLAEWWEHYDAVSKIIND